MEEKLAAVRNLIAQRVVIDRQLAILSDKPLTQEKARQSGL